MSGEWWRIAYDVEASSEAEAILRTKMTRTEPTLIEQLDDDDEGET